MKVMLPPELRAKSARPMPEWDSLRLAYGLSLKDLSDICGPFSRSSYWRWMKEEVAAVIAVEIGMTRVMQAVAEAEREIRERAGDPETAPILRLMRFADEKSRNEGLALTADFDPEATEYLPFGAYGAMFGRLYERLTDAGYAVEVRFLGSGPSVPENRMIFVPNPPLPPANIPRPARTRTTRKRHYG